MDIHDDDANPIAMGSGMLLGMAIGLVIMAGMPAWRGAATELCKFAAVEAGQNGAVECAGVTAADVPRIRMYR